MTGRVVVVTGGSRGIGKAVSLRLGTKGDAVVVGYRSARDDAEAVAADIVERGGRAIAVQVDVCREVDVIRLFDVAQQQLGPVGGVVNNAGIVAPLSQLADMTFERLEHLFSVNVLGAYLVARETARRLSTARGGAGGALVNLSSAASRLGSPNEYVDYAGSKAALDTLTIGLAKELGPQGVRVNAVRPGLIETEIHATSGDPLRAQRLGAAMPQGRAGSADEVAAAIVWLLSDEASYVTGALLDVAGGR